MGNLGLLMKLYNWYTRFIGILKGEVAPPKGPVEAIDVQLALLRKGYYGVPLHGKLDDKTREYLKKFQADNGLEPDGLFGPTTWEKLSGGK